MNKIILVSPQGEERRVNNLINSKIIFNGDNSTIKIYEPYKSINRLICTLGNNCNIEIGNNLHIVDVLHINASADYSYCKIGGGVYLMALI